MTPGLISQGIPPSLFDERDDTLLIWLGMASVLINSRGTILLIDPLLTAIQSGGRLVSEIGYRLKIALPIEAEHLPRADGVLYTHADDDHFGRTTAGTLARRLQPTFVAPPPVRSLLAETGVDAAHILTARDFASLHIGTVEVTVTPAQHDWQEEDPWQRGDCCGYIVTTPDGTIWHPGDTRLIDELLEIRDVDVLFFDVAAVDAHLGPAGSARLAETCGAQILIPYHYGLFDLPPGSFGGCDPADALPYVKHLPVRFLQLNPGEPLRLPLAPIQG